MTSRRVITAARQARSALVSLQAIPGLTQEDAAESIRLISEADMLTEFAGDEMGTANAEKALLTGLRVLLAKATTLGDGTEPRT